MTDSMRSRVALALFLTAVAWTVPHAAYAQVAAGGGSFLSGLMNELEGSIIPVVSTIAVIVLGIIMAAARASMMTIGAVCVGVWIAANATTIYGWLRA